MLLLSVVSAGFGLKSFIVPNGFIDGGVMGISILTNSQTGFSLSILILIISLPFLLLGWQQIGKGFTIKSIMAIAFFALVFEIIPYPVVTNDKLLVAFFGGFFLVQG